MMASICVVVNSKRFGREHLPSAYEQLQPDVAFLDRVGRRPCEIAAKIAIRRHSHGVTAPYIACDPANRIGPAYLSFRTVPDACTKDSRVEILGEQGLD